MDLINPTSAKFLGGTNIRNVVMIAALAFVAYKLK